MKTALFFGALVALMLLGAFIRFGDKFFKASEISKSTVQDGISAPQGYWKTVLPGKWRFSFERRSDTRTVLQQGMITYLADGYFKRLVTIKYFGVNSNASFENADMRAMYGGNISGKWDSVDETIWKEIITDCNLELSYTDGHYSAEYVVKTACPFYEENQSYGTYEMENIQMKLSDANSTSILITGTDFTDGGKISYQLNKLSE